MKENRKKIIPVDSSAGNKGKHGFRIKMGMG
jgi:hypothetical protein